MNSDRPHPRAAPGPGERRGWGVIAVVGVGVLALVLSACGDGEREIGIPETDLESVEGFRKLVDLTSGDNRLLVYCFGSPPGLIRQECIQGEGLHLLVVNRHAQRASFRRVWTEASVGVTIDYSQFDTGVLQLTSLTTDPRAKWGEPLPFIRTVLAFSTDGSYRQDDAILIEPEPGDAERITQLAEQALAAVEEAKGEDAFSLPLYHLRNIAVRDPKPVHVALERLWGRVPPGALLEILNDRMNEVERMQAVRRDD